MSATRISPDELRVFTERIGRSLRERPLSLGREEHRGRVAEVFRQFGNSNHYETLRVSASASAAEVHEGYERAARLLHPMHAPALGLEDRAAVLEVLFEHATAAYLTLSQLERRKEYDRTLDPAAFAPSPSTRPDEQKDRARQYYNQAATLVNNENFFDAIALLKHAVLWDPRAEYYYLLGQAQARNPNWLGQAADSYRRALEVGGSNPMIETALRRLEAKIAGEGPETSDDGSPGGIGDRYDPSDDTKRWIV